MKQYLDFLRHILENGTRKENRTGIDTISVFGYQMRFDLSKGLPVVTTKKIHLPSVIHELLWFLKGDTNIKYLQDHNVRIWNEWADEQGNLGPVYGKQWRDFGGVDQISWLINELKTNPDSRRLIVSAWNPPELNQMALQPCHVLMQFCVSSNKLSCQLYQRSADAFLGVPFNIVSYALLTEMLAQQCNFEIGDFIWTGGDCHIYSNHLEQVNLQLSRQPFDLPKLKFKKQPESIFDYRFEDFEIENYQFHPAIKAPVAV